MAGDWRATADSSRADTRPPKKKVTKATTTGAAARSDPGRKPKTSQREVQKRVAARTQR